MSKTRPEDAARAEIFFRAVHPDQILNQQTAGGFVDCLRRVAAYLSDVYETSGDSHQELRAARAKLQQPHKRQESQGELDFGKYHTRFAALEVFYLGRNYHGFASQDTDTVQTIEAAIFAALKRTCLIPKAATWQQMQYSRCGRTDKGVSALGQVIALQLRSRGSAEEPLLPAEEELDYAATLNRALPGDIRVLGWCDAPRGFNARFSTLHREYKYHIIQDGSLDVSAMQAGADHLLGEHDFRNFCKVDAAHVANFRRTICRCRVEPMHGCGCGNRTLYVIHIVGTAFLWHQVRCIAAVLLMVGQGLEQPDIVHRLLDISDVARKPLYCMAPEAPLMLSACAYEDMSWRRSVANCNRVEAAARAALDEHLLAAGLLYNAFKRIQADKKSLLASLQADLHTRKAVRAHRDLLHRATEPPIEERMLTCMGDVS